jgi:predicted dehydrogenase
MQPSDERPQNVPIDDSRREFLRAGAAVGIGAALAHLGASELGAHEPPPLAGPAPGPFAAPPMEKVRIGFVGVGGMGMVHVRNLLAIPGAEIRAVCDIVEEKVAKAQDAVVKAGFAKPAGYSRGPRDFERMCQEEELDLVYTATPWEWHVPVCVAAMKAGKHAATEVPAAYTVDDCWLLVETAEKQQKHCVMMENCNYGRPELLMLNMVRKGLFGELLHGECGYLHDLREIKFSKEGEGLWRRAHSMRRNGNLYPTHGLGPIANCMDINRGDRFDYVVSMSSNSRGLRLYAAEHFEAGDPRRGETFKLGDVNVALIRTVNGRTIYLAHNVDNPRPYSRINTLQGTKGIFEGYPDRVHIEGRSPNHRWETLEKYYEEFEHPLWKNDEVKGSTAGHGGMDFLEDRRLIECLRAGVPTDMNVYDAAALSVMTPLTERSVASRSRPQDVPDFTRGRWKTTPPLGIIGE